MKRVVSIHHVYDVGNLSVYVKVKSLILTSLNKFELRRWEDGDPGETRPSFVSQGLPSMLTDQKKGVHRSEEEVDHEDQRGPNLVSLLPSPLS